MGKSGKISRKKTQNDSSTSQSTLTRGAETFYKVYGEEDFADEDAAREKVLETMRINNEYDLLDYGHCIKESVTLKMQIREQSVKFSIYERSIDSFDSIIKKYAQTVKPLKKLKASCLSQVNESLTSPKDTEIREILDYHLTDTSRCETDEDRFYNDYLQGMVDNHREEFKALKKCYSEYEKSSIVFESNMHKKSTLSPVSKSAGVGQDEEANHAAMKFYITQLSMAHVMNRIRIQKEFTPSEIALRLLNLNQQSKTKIESKEGPSYIKFLNKRSKDFQRISSLIDFTYQWYVHCLNTNNIQPYMSGIPEGYMERRKPNERTFSKKSWYFIENNHLVEYVKKSDHNDIILQDINKIAFSPSNEGNELQFDCLDPSSSPPGVQSFRCNTALDVQMWLSGLETIKQVSAAETSSLAPSPTTDSQSTSPKVDRLESLKLNMSMMNRKSIVPTAALMNQQNSKKCSFSLPTLGNDRCADCGARRPEWFSLNLGVMFCIICCGKHRALGANISKPRSSEMDEVDPLTSDMMLQLGNIQANIVKEYKISEMNLQLNRTEVQFFKDKYDLKLYQPSSKEEWDDCATKYINAVKSTHPNDKFTEEVEMFKKILSKEEKDISKMLQFNNVSFIYFLIAHGENFVDIDIGAAITSAARKHKGLPIAFLYYNGTSITKKDGNGNNIGHLAAMNKYENLYSFIKSNYVVRLDEPNNDGQKASDLMI